MATQTVTISLPEELVHDIDLLAQDRNVDREIFIEQLLSTYCGTELPVYSEENLLESIREADAGLTSPLDEVLERIRSRTR